VDEELVVEVELMNERGELWYAIASGATVDAAVARVEAQANATAHDNAEAASWVMNDWRAV
jgi:hypothetical protein